MPIERRRPTPSTPPARAARGRTGRLQPWADVFLSGDRFRHLLEGIVVGIGVTAFAWLALWAVLCVWSRHTGYPLTLPEPPATGLSMADVAAAQPSFAQVFLGFFGIFLAGALGYYAYREFIEGQEQPVGTARSQLKRSRRPQVRYLPEPPQPERERPAAGSARMRKSREVVARAAT